MNGKCMDLAAAIHYDFGWDIYVETYDGWEGSVPGESHERLIHAWVRHPDTGILFDARGPSILSALAIGGSEFPGWKIYGPVTPEHLEILTDTNLGKNETHIIEAMDKFITLFCNSCM